MPHPEDRVPHSDPKKICLKHPHGEEDAPRKRGIPGITQPGRWAAAASAESTLGGESGDAIDFPLRASIAGWRPHTQLCHLPGRQQVRSMETGPYNRAKWKFCFPDSPPPMPLIPACP